MHFIGLFFQAISSTAISDPAGHFLMVSSIFDPGTISMSLSTNLPP
jgi:hypothetical protein